MHPVLHNPDLEQRNVDRMSKLWERRVDAAAGSSLLHAGNHRRYLPKRSKTATSNIRKVRFRPGSAIDHHSARTPTVMSKSPGLLTPTAPKSEPPKSCLRIRP